MSDSKVAEYVASHPKTAGVLFAALLLLNSSGVVMASIATTNPGP